MIRRPPRSTRKESSAASDVYKRQDSMGEDLLHRIRLSNNNMELTFTTEIYNEVLILIEDVCLSIANKRLGQLGLSDPCQSTDVQDRDLSRESQFDVEQLRQFVEYHSPMMVGGDSLESVRIFFIPTGRNPTGFVSTSHMCPPWGRRSPHRRGEARHGLLVGV